MLFNQKLFCKEKERCIKSATERGHKHLKLVELKSNQTDVFLGLSWKLFRIFQSLEKIITVVESSPNKNESAKVFARGKYGQPVTILSGSWTDLKQLLEG